MFYRNVQLPKGCIDIARSRVLGLSTFFFRFRDSEENANRENESEKTRGGFSRHCPPFSPGSRAGIIFAPTLLSESLEQATNIVLLFYLEIKQGYRRILPQMLVILLIY